MCTTTSGSKNITNEIMNRNCGKNNLRKSDVFKNNLMFWYSVAVNIHATLLACRLFSIDFSQSEIEELRVYHATRWQLITVWSSLLTFGYYIVSAYCEWKIRKKESQEPHVVKLNDARHFLFTSLVLPSTLFADTIFWKAWTANRLLVAPVSVDAYVTIYDQHLLHTVSYLFVLFDGLLVERKKPKNKKLHLGLLIGWATLYHIVLAIAMAWHGMYVYPLLKTYSPTDKVVICLFSYSGHLFYYFIQWRFNGILMKYILNKMKIE